ncbi:MAG: hypothetical protein KC550_04470, partial [Nanoarchaeota archaeon]|nr:hypothetical protein [Nanoarchaeota archaeon]
QLGPNPNISPPESFSFEVLRLETETGRVYIVNGGINNSQKLINNITIFHNSEKVCEKKKINEYILIEEIKNFEFTNCKLINNDPYSIIIIYDNNKTMTDVNIAR